MKCKPIKRENYIYVFLLMVASLSGIVWMFTNVGIDVTYQVSMAYRYLKGDIPVLEMWEPHQTSVFLNVPLMWLYMKVMGTVDGIVLYLQIIGILIRAAIAFYLYKTVRLSLESPVSFCIAVLFFMISPKDYAIPEFGNMQAWFGALLFCFLYRYIRSNKVIYLFLSSISTSLLVLSYPSCVLLYIPVVIFVGIYGGEKRVRGICIYTLMCVAIGALIIGWIVSKVGFERLPECVEGMLSLEPSHTGSQLAKVISYLKDLCAILVTIFSVNVATFWIEQVVLWIIFKLRNITFNKEARIKTYVTLLFLIYDVLFFINILSADNRCAYGVGFVNVICLGMFFSRRLNREQHLAYVLATVLSLTCLLATLILTDLPLLVSMAYATLGIGIALLPIYEQSKKANLGKFDKFAELGVVVFIVLLAFRAAYIRTPIVGRGQIFVTSIDELSMVKNGPAKGIITDQNSSARERDGILDYRNHVGSDDKVLIIDGLVNSFAYMYTEAEIAVPSVMSDPKYSENMLRYYEINPDKTPNVLAAASYEGELDYEIEVNEWLREWIVAEFGATRIEKGTYWTFYFR